LLDCLHWEIIVHHVIRKPELASWRLGVELNWNLPTEANEEVDNHLFYLGFATIILIVLEEDGFFPIVVFSVDGDCVLIILEQNVSITCEKSSISMKVPCFSLIYTVNTRHFE
jgi:hypothetical protein